MLVVMPETMEMPIIGDRLDEIVRSVVDHAGAKMVFGEPVTVEGKTILPVAKVRYGFGGGAGRKRDGEQQGGGGGGGLVAKPVGLVEITESETRFIRIAPNWNQITAVLAGVFLARLLFPKRRG